MDGKLCKHCLHNLASQWCTINNICSKIGSGSTPRGSNYATSGIPFFRSQNVHNFGLVYDDIKYIAEDVHQRMIGTEVLSKDLLLNITGGSLGRCAIVPNDFEIGNVSQHVCILRTLQILPEYLHGFIVSDYFSETMILSGSGREGLPKYSLEAMLFPLPPLAEQHRIVAEIEKWFTLIDTIESGKDNLQSAIKQAKSKILDLAIHGKLVPQDSSDEPASELLKRINPKAQTATDNAHYQQLPMGWCFCPIKDVFNVTMGQSPKGESINRSEGIEFHQGKLSFGEKYLNNSYSYTSEPTKFAEPQSILICVRAPVGIVNITDRKICIGRGLATLYPSKSINLDYGFYLLQCCKESFEAQSTGSTFKAISGDIIKNEFIPIPPLAEQQRIVSKIETLFKTLDTIAENI